MAIKQNAYSLIFFFKDKNKRPIKYTYVHYSNGVKLWDLVQKKGTLKNVNVYKRKSRSFVGQARNRQKLKSLLTMY